MPKRSLARATTSIKVDGTYALLTLLKTQVRTLISSPTIQQVRSGSKIKAFTVDRLAAVMNRDQTDLVPYKELSFRSPMLMRVLEDFMGCATVGFLSSKLPWLPKSQG